MEENLRSHGCESEVSIKDTLFCFECNDRFKARNYGQVKTYLSTGMCPTCVENAQTKDMKEIEMGEFKVESGININDVPTGRTKYPFRFMNVGDSFKFDETKTQTVKVAAYAYGNRHRKKFAVRCTNNEARVWRIK